MEALERPSLMQLAGVEDSAEAFKLRLRKFFNQADRPAVKPACFRVRPAPEASPQHGDSNAFAFGACGCSMDSSGSTLMPDKVELMAYSSIELLGWAAEVSLFVGSPLPGPAPISLSREIRNVAGLSTVEYSNSEILVCIRFQVFAAVTSVSTRCIDSPACD